ncbi:MAG: hypothetical protein UW84_C0029G0003 [Candidatus Collierbacteria bacterium GW2011_GWA2_44_99]|uniref:Uncharacterized protein n=1 Tax=Candidatus Collierbacteria bacterium GW2011_GWA2_44_99 TaxID=1618380 RepID=A0A0G1MXI2_9BACT|nr:MAG: hypothetical protein UW84_C0029G0003 [Candidatus Collierbacteria bacterium GW2011_GWA2_44_99]
MKMLGSFDLVVGERSYFSTTKEGIPFESHPFSGSRRRELRGIGTTFEDNIILHSHVASTPVAFTKERFLKTGGIDESMKAAYDWDLVLKLIYQEGDISKPGYAEEVHLNYRERPNSLSNVHRESQFREGEKALNETFKRMGVENLQAVFEGRVDPGYLRWRHDGRGENTTR